MSKLLLVLVVLAGGFAIVYCGTTTPNTIGDTGEDGDGGGTKICKQNADCNVAAGETCLGSRCVKVECKQNSECKDSKKQCCNVTTYQCAACGTPDGGGGGDGGTDGGADVGPTGCTGRDQCKPDKWCEIVNGVGSCQTMGTCDADEKCAVGQVCNTFTKACECLNDDSCKDWADGKTACDPQLKQCDKPQVVTCDPPCDAACKDCVNGSCVLKSGVECCADDDCITPPNLYCDTATHLCYEKHTCGDSCSSKQDCIDWCGGNQYDCVGSACIASECTTDPDCATICSPYTGTCASGTCSCNVTGIGQECDLCSTDGDCDTAQGLTCGTFSFGGTVCSRPCTTTADCQVATWCGSSTQHCYCFKTSCCNNPDVCTFSSMTCNPTTCACE